MTLISKTAAGLSLFSAIRDIHKTAVIYSNNEAAKSQSDAFIETSLGTQKANRISSKDASRKNWLLKNNFFGGINETSGKVKGYLNGFLTASIRYIPNFILSAFALIAKSKTIGNIAAVGLGIVEIYDYLKNSTGLFQNNDYLK